MATKWTLSDPASGDFYTFEINPNSGGSPTVQKGLTYYQTTSDNSALLLYEGADQPQMVQVSGTLLSQDQYQAMMYWYGKRNQVLLTDDLGRTQWVYFASFTPTRKWSVQHPWRHDWQAQWYVVGRQYLTPPSVCTSVVAEPGGGRAFLAYVNSDPSITTFKVVTYNLTNPAQNVPVVTNPTELTIIPSLTNGDQYTFTVAAVNAQGLGSVSPTSNIVVPYVGGP